MILPYHELNRSGIVGILVYWSRSLLSCINIAFILFSIFWLTRLSSPIWLNSVGVDLLLVILIEIILSIASLVFQFFSHCCNKKQKSHNFALQFCIVLNVISVCVLFVLRYFTSDSYQKTSKNSFKAYIQSDHANKNFEDDVHHFQDYHSASSQESKFFYERLSDNKTYIDIFAICWILILAVYVIGGNSLQFLQKKEK